MRSRIGTKKQESAGGIPVSRGKVLAKERLAAEEAKCTKPAFRPRDALRLGLSMSTRRCWRWAVTQQIRLRHHFTIVTTETVKAHDRLGVSYFEEEEYEIAREHFGRVIELTNEVRPEFWRRVARCDVEIFHKDGNEERLQSALDAYRRCFDRTVIDVATVGQVPKLCLDVARVYELYGAHTGAVHFLSVILEYFPRSSVFQKAAFRCALVLKHLATLPGTAIEDRSRLLTTAKDLLDKLLLLREEEEEEEGEEDTIEDDDSDLVGLYLSARVYHVHGLDSAAQDAYERLFLARHARRRPDATIFSPDVAGLRSWLRSRRTWYAIATQVVSKEPTLVVDAIEYGLVVSKVEAPIEVPTSDNVWRHFLVGRPFDDVGMLLLARQAYTRLFDPREKHCSDRAFQGAEWDVRAREVAGQDNPEVAKRLSKEAAAVTRIKTAWRARVWRSPFLCAVKAMIIERAELAIQRDRFGAHLARSELAYFAAPKWRPLLIYEDRGAVHLQRFLRAATRRRQWTALLVSRHRRALGTVLTKYNRDPSSLELQCRLVDLVASKLTPPNHPAIDVTDRIHRQHRAVPHLQRIARGGLVRRRRRQESDLVVVVDDPLPVVTGDDVVQDEEETTSDDDSDAVATTTESSEVQDETDAVEVVVTGLVRGPNDDAATVVTRTIRDVGRRKKATKLLMGRRHEVTVRLQRLGRRWLGRRQCAARLIGRIALGWRGRRRAGTQRTVRGAAWTIYGTWRRHVHRQRGAMLLKRLASSEKTTSELALTAVDQASRFAMTEGALWPQLGIPGTPAFAGALRRTAVVARNLTKIDVALSPLWFDHWNCRLRSVALVNCTLSDPRLLTSLGGCVSLRDLVLVRCGLSDATCLFQAVAAGGASLMSLILDDVPNLGTAAAVLLGDYCFQRRSCLRVVALCRCGLGDDGAAAIGSVLAITVVAELHLDENHIGDAGADAIANGLAHNRRLVTLSLQQNRIGCPGAHRILATLCNDTSVCPLHRLSLKNNYVDDDILPVILCFMASPRFPPALDLQGNPWRPGHFARLTQQLRLLLLRKAAASTPEQHTCFVPPQRKPQSSSSLTKKTRYRQRQFLLPPLLPTATVR